MSRSNRNRKKVKKVIVLIEILCMIALCFGVFKIVNNRIEERKQQAIAQEAAKQAELERQQIEEELNKWNLILVNNSHAIPDNYDITTKEIEDDYKVDERIYGDLRKMIDDCRDAGYEPKVISAFRTREFQQSLYDRAVNKNDTAKPGHSEHECGLAADIIDADSLSWGDPLIDKQEDMPAQKWLMEHCQDYGFILRYPKDKEDVTEIIYEPWHYRYVGKEHAKKIMENGICLEEYLE